jgi:hypothetical protein
MKAPASHLYAGACRHPRLPMPQAANMKAQQELLFFKKEALILLTVS